MLKYIIGIILILLLIAMLYLGWFFFCFAVTKEGKDLPNKGGHGAAASPWKKYTNVRKDDRKWARKLEGEDLWITSRDKLRMHAKYYRTENPKRIILCAHGYRATGLGDFASQMRWLLRDSDILLIDERACGESEGKYITFGAKEKQDIILWTQELANRNSAGLPVYLYGISLGASSVLMASVLEKNVKLSGVIADCGYSSMAKIVCELSKKWFKLPGYPLIWFISLYCVLLGHFRMGEADVAGTLKKATVPVLLVHGMDDDFVVPSHSETNYNACASKKRLLKIDHAWHALAYLEDTKTYQNAMTQFFAENDKA